MLEEMQRLWTGWGMEAAPAGRPSPAPPPPMRRCCTLRLPPSRVMPLRRQTNAQLRRLVCSMLKTTRQAAALPVSRNTPASGRKACRGRQQPRRHACIWFAADVWLMRLPVVLCLLYPSGTEARSTWAHNKRGNASRSTAVPLQATFHLARLLHLNLAAALPGCGQLGPVPDEVGRLCCAGWAATGPP